MDFTEKNVAVLGFGLEGKDAVNFLLGKKANITVFDQKPLNELDFSATNKENITFITGENYLSSGFEKFDYIVRSPGFYRYHPILLAAEQTGVIITSPLNIFFQLNPAHTIGITGTKGKGTTSSLIYEILKATGRKVFLAGNIGNPVLSLLSQLTPDDWVVLELSSFQLIDSSISPNISVVLNITQDHMDWHKNVEEYIDAKKNIVLHQTETDTAIINDDYQTSKSFDLLGKSKKYYFSKSHTVNGCYVENGVIKLNIDGDNQTIGRTNNLLLRGEHNWENITAAICAAYTAQADIKAIREAVFSFKGLEHRLELIRTVKNVSFYNDSFSTNPQTTIAAVHSFSEPTILILGGSSKDLIYDEMATEIVKRNTIKAILLIGDIAEQIKESLRKANYPGIMVDLGKSLMIDIVKKAFELSDNGDVVLLSPATASFDMFANYKDRGNQFKNAVNEL